MGPGRAPTTETFPAVPGTPSRMRRAIRYCGAADRVPDDAVDDLALAVTEAANNAIRHSSTPAIDLVWRAETDRVEVEVRDRGVFRHDLPLPGSGRTAWGLRLMAAMVDEVALHPGTKEHPGTSVRLVRSWAKSA